MYGYAQQPQGQFQQGFAAGSGTTGTVGGFVPEGGSARVVTTGGSPTSGASTGVVAVPGGGLALAGAAPVSATSSGQAGGGGLCCGLGGVQQGGSMKFVGDGGNYVIETTYKYVGGGSGDYDLAGPSASRWPVCLGGLVLIAAVGILAALYMPGSIFTTTRMSSSSRFAASGPRKDCVMWGDPHVKTFDESFPNVYGEGEFWIIKSDQAQIQGRFLATPFTNGLAALSAISVGISDGTGHHTVSVGPLEHGGMISCNGAPIMQDFPSQGNCGSVRLWYNDQGKLVDEAQNGLDRKIVHIEVSEVGLHLQVMRWANHLNTRITAPAYPGQDGICGNFNGSPDDDTPAKIMERLGGRVPKDQLLFMHRTSASGAPTKTLADCDSAKRMHAFQVCKQNQPNAKSVLLNSCIFDVCFGGEHYAQQDGLSISQVLHG